MITLIEYLRNLSIDPGQLSRFIKDHNRNMWEAGLDSVSQRILFSGSPELVYNELKGNRSSTTSPDFNYQTRSSSHASLIVVGTGIHTFGQLSIAAISWMMAADAVLYLVADPIAEAVINYLNPKGSISLMPHYGEGVDREVSYEGMVTQIMHSIRSGKQTCVALYGHPGVFAYPAHEAIRRARTEGFSAYMIPAISAEDCLFADLGIDPAVSGCQSYESTDFILHDKRVEVNSHLILWQIGVVGDRTYRRNGYKPDIAFKVIVDKLLSLYGRNHIAIVYEAAVLPGTPPKIQPIDISKMTPECVTAHSTLYIPPLGVSKVDTEVASKIGWELSS